MVQPSDLSKIQTFEQIIVPISDKNFCPKSELIVRILALFPVQTKIGTELL